MSTAQIATYSLYFGASLSLLLFDICTAASLAVHVFPASPTDDEFPLVQNIPHANIVSYCVLRNLAMFPRSLLCLNAFYGDGLVVPSWTCWTTRTIWTCVPQIEIRVGWCYFLSDIPLYVLFWNFGLLFYLLFEIVFCLTSLWHYIAICVSCYILPKVSLP
jgi:hypothetical protein